MIAAYVVLWTLVPRKRKDKTEARKVEEAKVEEKGAEVRTEGGNTAA